MAEGGFVIRVKSPEQLGKIQLKKDDIVRLVSSSAGKLAAVMRSSAPVYTGPARAGVVPGALRRGIVPSPVAEKSASPYKTVYEVYWDEKMNGTFVKVAKSGKRYYYPASQEYGFRTKRGLVPGKYFMSGSLVAYVPVMDAEIDRLVEEALK